MYIIPVDILAITLIIFALSPLCVRDRKQTISCHLATENLEFFKCGVGNFGELACYNARSYRVKFLFITNHHSQDVF